MSDFERLMTLPPGDWDPRIQHAVRILENEQTPLPSTAEVATRIGLSAFHFVRLFKAQVGTPPQSYARAFLLDHVASRLRYTTDPVETVALDFGYSDLTALNRAFKRQFGLPPQRWRLQAREALPQVPSGDVRLEHVAPFTCLSRRYLGPRQEGGIRWRDFLDRLPEGLRSRARIGLAYDDPRITPPERLRYDCAVTLTDQDRASLSQLRSRGFEVLSPPPGMYATADAASLDQIGAAYLRILAAWAPRNPAWALEGDPFLERFTITPDDVTAPPKLTVGIRVRPVEVDRQPNMPVAGADGASTET